VLAWGHRHLRDLPWRATRDPWQVLVAEVMLQQTQVSRVLPAWPGFLARYPDASACAAAPLAEVLGLWTGLGYPRRARHLHLAAVEIHRLGCVPDTLEGLLALPGVGAYTARAVLAFAFERDVAVVDTNIARLYARIEGRTLGGREVQALADAAAPAGDGWRWNQAVMDLGATVCTARDPSCSGCPARRWCRWAARGRPDPDPSVGSARVSGRQAPFEGSDRQGRGRLLRAVLRGPVAVDDLALAMGWPDQPERARRVADGLVTDGLVARGPDGVLRAP
jgi:A/G-specific adenine glycosylase